MTTDNVIDLPVITRLNLDADRVLENLKGKLDGFILAGYDKAGEMFFSSTYADGGEVLWLLEHCKKDLLDI